VAAVLILSISSALDGAHASLRFVAANCAQSPGLSDNPGDSDPPRIRTRASALRVRPGRPDRERAEATEGAVMERCPAIAELAE